MSTGSSMERREFLQAVTAGSLVLAVGAAACRRTDDELRGAKPAAADGLGASAYLRIDDTGAVTIICHRSEMGQGIRTSLPMVLADELEADWSRVRVEQAPGDEKTFGSQNTDGSSSIREFLVPFREAGATARTLLEQAAAKQWGVAATQVQARQHQVVDTATGKTLPFGALVAVARTLPVPDKKTLKLKDASAFRYIGKEVAGIDQHDMTVGRAVYGFDVRRDGMKYAVIARPPVYGGKAASVDSSEAEKVPGVEKIVRLDGAEPPAAFNPIGGVAVIARNTWAAIEGRKKLRITWTDGPNASYDSEQFRAELEGTARKPGKAVRQQGDVDGALRGAAKTVSADYFVPHLAHAPMEPPAALAVVENGRCEVWAATQNPQGARETVAAALGMKPEQVTVHVTLLGGAFGRKSKPDYVAEAALLAQKVGAPVRVMWTREDDIRHDYFHTVTAQHLEAGLDAGGKVVGWLHRTVLPSISSTFAKDKLYASDSELGQGVTDLPFAIPNIRAENGPAPAHVRIGWYRSVINIPHAFAIGTFVDELAHAAGKDPRAFWLDLLGPDRIVDLSKAGLAGEAFNYGESFEKHPIDIARYRKVLELVTEKSGWGSPLPKGHGRGLAVHRSFVSYVAVVVQVAVKPDGTLEIPRVDVAADPGFITNPDRVRAQFEGATVMGLSNALYGEVSFKNGRAVQSNYTDYKVARMDAAPREVRVHLVAGSPLPGGVGEPGVPPIAPALGNAIFAATGVRIRRLPVGNQLATRGVA